MSQVVRCNRGMSKGDRLRSDLASETQCHTRCVSRTQPAHPRAVAIAATHPLWGAMSDLHTRYCYVAGVLVTSTPSSAPTYDVPRHPQLTWLCFGGRVLWGCTRQIHQRDQLRSAGCFVGRCGSGGRGCRLWRSTCGDLGALPGRYSACGSRWRLCHVFECRQWKAETCPAPLHCP